MTCINLVNGAMRNKVLGYTEEITTCACCGRADLKGTYVIENAETGAIGHYGSVCAFKAFNLTVGKLKASVKLAEVENARIATAEYRQSNEYITYQAHLRDRELVLKGADKDTYFGVVRETYRLSALAEAVHTSICRKHRVTKTYLVPKA